MSIQYNLASLAFHLSNATFFSERILILNTDTSVFSAYWYWYLVSILQIEYWYWYFSIWKSYWILNTSIFILYWSGLWVVLLCTTIRPNKNRMGAQSSNTRKIVNRLVSLPGPLLLTEYALLGWSKTLKTFTLQHKCVWWKFSS